MRLVKKGRISEDKVEGRLIYLNCEESFIRVCNEMK